MQKKTITIEIDADDMDALSVSLGRYARSLTSPGEAVEAEAVRALRERIGKAYRNAPEVQS